MVSVKVPVAAVVKLVTVRVVVPELVTLVGLNEPDAPAPKPATVNVTTPLKPPLGVICTV
jgi:hypothetical protein